MFPQRDSKFLSVLSGRLSFYLLSRVSRSLSESLPAVLQSGENVENFHVDAG